MQLWSVLSLCVTAASCMLCSHGRLVCHCGVEVSKHSTTRRKQTKTRSTESITSREALVEHFIPDSMPPTKKPHSHPRALTPSTIYLKKVAVSLTHFSRSWRNGWEGNPCNWSSWRWLKVGSPVRLRFGLCSWPIFSPVVPREEDFHRDSFSVWSCRTAAALLVVEETSSIAPQVDFEIGIVLRKYCLLVLNWNKNVYSSSDL